jgi:LysM repeat protein
MKKILLGLFFSMAVFVLQAQSKVHVVKPGETLYALCKKYSVTVTQLKALNKQLVKSTSLQVGQKIIISASAGNASVPSKGTSAKIHTVTKGESLTTIAKKYGVSITTLKQWNSLRDLNVKIGQKLIVSKANTTAQYKPAPVASTPDTEYSEEDTRRQRTMKPVDNTNNTSSERAVTESNFPSSNKTAALTTDGLRTTSSDPTEYPAIFNQYSVNGFQIKKSRGTAGYLAEATSGNQNLAFYSGAEAGSIIRVTNMVNQKTIYVKVIGKLPPADSSKGLNIKLSNEAAMDLGATEDKLLVEVASFFKE